MRDCSTIVVTQTSDGTSSGSLSGIQLRPRHEYGATTQTKSDICVIDSITFARDNTDSGSAATVVVSVTPYGMTAPIWRAVATAPVGECITIDKTFPEGLPIWLGTLDNASSTDPLYVYSGLSGNSQSGTTSAAYNATVSVKIDFADWVGSVNGLDTLTVLYHFEPATARRR